VEALRLFKLLNRTERKTFLALFSRLGADAFDIFRLTFVRCRSCASLAGPFPKSYLNYPDTNERPLGRTVFALLGTIGRRIPLMADIIFYSVID
jgi:hypothetical protein